MMRILVANLRHLYQRRGLWLLHAALAFVVLLVALSAVSSPSKGKGVFGGFLMCSFLLGLLVALMQMETSSRPFSFCLPGHRHGVRSLVFVVGLGVSAAFLLLVVALLALTSFTGPFERAITSPALLVLVLGAYFCASMTAYLLGAGVAFGLIHSASAASVMTFVVVVCVAFDLFTTIQYPILHWPVAVIALALVVALAGWWWLGRPAWLRRYCDRPWIGFFDPWDRSQTQRYRAIYAARFIKNTPELDRFFHGVIGRRPLSGLGKHAWGALYTTFALLAMQWKGLLSIVLMAVVWAVYVPAAAPASIGVASLILMLTGLVQPPLGTTLLIGGGRKERFFATITLILVLSTASVLLVGALVGLTHLLAPFVPAVTWKGHTWHPQAISLQALAVPLVVLPLVGLIQTLFYRKPTGLALSIMLVTTLMMISPGLYRAVTPMLAVGGVVLSWSVCMLLLYRIAMRSDLVRQ
jgi:hypothetical protein